MKKLLLTMALALCVSVPAFASPASDLTREDPLAGQVTNVLMGKAPFSTIAKDIAPEFVKDFNEEKVKMAVTGMKDAFGNASSSEMVVYMRDGMHRVGYVISYPGDKYAMVMTLFKDGKIAGVAVTPMQKNQ